MSLSYRLAALVAGSAVFAVPALADGVKDKHVNRGPAPLEAQSQHIMTQKSATKHYAQHTHAHQHTHTHAHSHTGHVTQHYGYRQAPTTQRRVVKTSHARVRQDNGLRIDTAAFTGGVGAGVDGGYYGGGGGFITFGASGGSYVLSHSAARFAFNRSHSGTKRSGHGGGCGC